MKVWGKKLEQIRGWLKISSDKEVIKAPIAVGDTLELWGT